MRDAFTRYEGCIHYLCNDYRGNRRPFARHGVLNGIQNFVFEMRRSQVIAPKLG